MASDELPTLADLFPAAGRVLLTGSGRQVAERIGLEVVRAALLNVMLGENIRDQTEPLTRQRITQLSGAVIAMFLNGWLAQADFSQQLSELAVEQILASRRNDHAKTWPAQWVLGLTEKSMQNVLRDDRERLRQYAADFDALMAQAAAKCRADFGDLRMSLRLADDAQGRTAELGWEEVARLTTAIGSQTLAIRGSEKSLYGKLFERLLLGSTLTLLGFRRVHKASGAKPDKIFWLSDSSAERESDATLIFKPGQLARFDVGFIGRGNSEISKDKLSRYTREAEASGSYYTSTTFIVIDRLPTRSAKTAQAAARIGAEIIQMSMQRWPKTLAQRLGARLGLEHELQTMADEDVQAYLAARLQTVPILDFLSGVVVEQAQAEDGSEMDEGEDE